MALTLSERQWGPIHGGPINLNSAKLPDSFLRFASLLDADLQAADLSRADLVHARLDRANLKNAILTDALLDHADFAGAELGRAIVRGASLSHARNLTQEQIDDTIGDASTTLPAYLETPSAWLEVAAETSRAPSPTLYRAMMVAAAVACLIAGIVIFAGPRDDRSESTVRTAAPFSSPSDVASSQLDARTATNWDSRSPNAGAPEPNVDSAPASTIAAAPQVQSPADGASAEPAVTADTEPLAEQSESAGESPIIASVRATAGVGTTASAQKATADVALQGPTVAALFAHSSDPLPGASASFSLDTPNDLDIAAKAKASALARSAEPPLPDRKPSFVETPRTPRVAAPAYVKPQPRDERRSAVLSQPLQVKPTSSTADVLAGGL